MTVKPPKLKPPKLKPPKLKPLDLTKSGGHGENVNHRHPDISAKKQYLCKIGGYYFAGQFHKAWFGWNFDGWEGTMLQYDKPGTNASQWQAIWEIIP